MRWMVLLVGLCMVAVSALAQPVGISGVVRLAPELALQVSGKDIVYVYVRDSETRRLSLATLRTTVRKLPLRFTLDDSMAPSSERRLSRFSRVDVLARVSRNPAGARRGPDMMGSVVDIGNDSSGVELVIDTLMVCTPP